MFQGIAHRERPGIPKVASAVYVLDENSKLIMHMYDDRGLDVIAHAPSTLLPIYDRFGDWILDNQRRKTSSRFGTLLSEADPSAPPSQSQSEKPSLARGLFFISQLLRMSRIPRMRMLAQLVPVLLRHLHPEVLRRSPDIRKRLLPLFV
jgi:hypothetical protein